VKIADALIDDVLAVTVTLPVAVEGIVMGVLKLPVDVVVKAKVADPTMTVPVVETLKPVPEAVTWEPAGPDVGLSETKAAGAAWAG
jgi:hypothetical protein